MTFKSWSVCGEDAREIDWSDPVASGMEILPWAKLRPTLQVPRIRLASGVQDLGVDELYIYPIAYGQ